MAGPLVYLDGSLIGNTRIRLRGAGEEGISGLIQLANGEPGQGQIVFEDPTYDFNPQGWTPLHVNEPLSVGTERIFTGYVAEQTYQRGQHYRTDSQRGIPVNINDTNVLLEAPKITGSDGNRPSETDEQRLDWLLASDYLGGMINDFGFVDPIGLTYDAGDFRGQSPGDVLNDLCGARGNIFFTYWSHADDAIGLFYDRPIDTTFTCPLTFSNVRSDITGDCYWAYIDPQMDSDPSEVYCQIRYVYAGGVVLLHNDLTHDTYFSWMPSGMHRCIQVENDKVGKQTTAASFATRLLEHYSVERRTIKFRSRLPAAKIGLIQGGMRLGVRFEHLPELLTQQYRRLESLAIAPTEDRRDEYDIECEVSVHGFRGAPGTGGGSTTPFPHITPPPPVELEWCVVADSGQNVADPDPHVTELFRGTIPSGHGARVNVDWLIDQFLPIAGWSNGAFFYSWDGGTEVAAFVVAVNHGAGGPTTPNLCWNGGGLSDCSSVGENIDIGAPAIPPGVDHVFRLFGAYQENHNSANDVRFCITINSVKDLTTGIDIGNELDPGAVDEGPSPGQWTEWAVVTMAGAAGATAFPYATGSLEVKVDGVLISPASYTETDNTTGDFTLDWAPDADEVVTVRYQGL